MGANIKIKDFYNCPIENEHSRGIRTIMLGEEVSSNNLGHVDYSMYYANGSCPIHVHDDSEEIFFFTRGSGTFHLADEKLPFKPGDIICVPKGVPHGLTCDSDVVTEHLVCCVKV